MPGNLTTVDAVKAYAGIRTTSDDALLARLVGVASAYIETWCDRSILAANYTERRSGNGRVRMITRQFPILSVAQVEIDGRPMLPAPTSGPVIGFDSYAIGRLDGGRFSQGTDNVVLSYRAGYEVVPADLEQACIEIVASRYRDRLRTGLQSQGVAGESVVFVPDELSRFARTVLGQYRRVATA